MPLTLIRIIIADLFLNTIKGIPDLVTLLDIRRTPKKNDVAYNDTIAYASQDKLSSMTKRLGNGIEHTAIGIRNDSQDISALGLDLNTNNVIAEINNMKMI
jgi:hypothetical protein